MTTTEQYKKLTIAQRRAEVLEEIRKFHKKNGRVPNAEFLGDAFRIRARRAFGGWAKALREALGKEPLRKDWTDEELLSILHSIREKTGRFPTSKDLDLVKSSFKRVLAVRFGSLAQANERAFGTSPRVEILKVLQKLTPPPCHEATTHEITHEARTFSKVEVGCHLDDLRNAHLVNCSASGKKATRAWSLNDKGRKFLKSFSKA